MFIIWYGFNRKKEEILGDRFGDLGISVTLVLMEMKSVLGGLQFTKI